MATGDTRSPLQLVCTECNWSGRERCDSCGGAGQFEIAGCPHACVSFDVRLAMKAAKRAEAGAWPVAGGWLDQTQKCLDAMEFIESEQQSWELRRLQGGE
jgi:hypothetical protein